jgi:16S rRNA (uracil1498-N3)-methyltransferase
VGRQVRFDTEQSHQISRVLRMRPGGRVVALDGTGREFEIVLEESTYPRVTGSVAGQQAAAGEPAVHLTLYQSLLKRDKFEWVLQKGTEIGVSRFVPVITSRSLVREAENMRPEKLERWRKIIKEAAEQSERGILPRLVAPISFKEATIEARNHDRALLAWEEARQLSIRAAIAGGALPRDLGLFIGPEGGFDQAEVEEATAQDVILVTLGRRVLRTETAAVVATALILHELGELG